MVKAPLVDEVRTHRLVVLDDSGRTRAVIGQDPTNAQRLSDESRQVPPGPSLWFRGIWSSLR